MRQRIAQLMTSRGEPAMALRLLRSGFRHFKAQSREQFWRGLVKARKNACHPGFTEAKNTSLTEDSRRQRGIPRGIFRVQNAQPLRWRGRDGLSGYTKKAVKIEIKVYYVKNIAFTLFNRCHDRTRKRFRLINTSYKCTSWR